METDFISSKGFNETRAIHPKSDNIEMMIGNETDEIIKKYLNLFCKNIKKH